MTGNYLHKHALGKPAELTFGDLTPVHRYERNCKTARKKMEALSPPEVMVLRGIMTGSSDKAIACQLELDLADVQGHHSSVMVKFGAKSTADAVRTAIYAGLQNARDHLRSGVAAAPSGKLASGTGSRLRK